MLNSRGLEALCAFIEVGSVARAAERLGRTTPQVGRLLGALERELGFALFDRSSRPLQLTTEGRTFALQAQAALAGVERLDQVGRQLRAGDRTHVRILTAPFLARAIVMDAVKRVADLHPEFTAEIDSRIRLDIEEWIEKESFDLGIASLPVQNPAFSTEPLIDVEAMCSMPADHPLARHRHVEFHMLKDHALVLQHPRSRVRTFIDKLCREQRVPLRVRFEAPNGLIAAQMVALGLGCGISDPLIAATAGEPNLLLRPFRPTLTISYAFLFPAWAPQSYLTRLLADEIKAIAQDRTKAIRRTGVLKRD